jgi:hypothetical protein
MFLALKNEVESAREKPKKKQNENDVVIPRHAWKWIVSSKCSSQTLGDSWIGNSTELHDADHRGEKNHDDAQDTFHLRQHLTRNRLHLAIYFLPFRGKTGQKGGEMASRL